MSQQATVVALVLLLGGCPISMALFLLMGAEVDL
jgi:hypothetical protein